MQPQLKNPSSLSTNPIGLRLKVEMKKRGFNSAELAKRADVKTSFIYDIISGKSTNPSSVKLARVAEALGVSLSFLADRGAKFSAGGDYISIAYLSVDAPTGGSVVVQEKEDEPYCFRKDWITGELHAEVKNVRLLSIRGDSMEPTLCHNDLIMVDTAKKIPSPPGMFVLFDGFGLVAKRLEYISHAQSPHIRIMSDNPQYATYERSLGETFIIGRVIWFAREM